MQKYIIILFFLIISVFSYSQTDTTIASPDTTKLGKKVKNSTLAMVLSAVVPGAGQVYNGKFWKVPFIYGGFYASFYFARKFNYQYQAYKNDILFVYDSTRTGPTTTGIYDLQTLVNDSSISRRKRDLTIIGAIAIYALNIIDAYIDAELSNFDVSEDLSMKIYPSINYFKPNNPNLSLTVQFYFK